VTDANLLTGRINPEYFLGGEIKVDIEAAREAMRKVAKPFGLSEAEASLGVIRLANSNMDNLLRIVSVRRGFDPRDFALVAFGGGGSMHATALARRLHIKRVIVPVATAVFSALGMLMTELRVDFIQTAITRTDRIDLADLMAILTKLEAEGFDALQQERPASPAQGAIERERVVIQRFADMRYLGQEHTVKVPLPGGTWDKRPDHGGPGYSAGAPLEEIERRFHDLHEQHYTFRLTSPIEFVNFHVTALGVVEKPSLQELQPDGESPKQALKGHREVDFDELGWHKSALYERSQLGAGAQVEGPAVVEEPAASTVLFPGDRLSVDMYGNLTIDVGS
jgi:N-methylhydantoinase A